MSADVINHIFVLLGVVVGFCLNIGYQKWELWRKNKQLKVSLLEELRSNLHMIPQKREILQLSIARFSANQFVPLRSVCFIKVFYTTHFPLVFHDLSIKERNSLHTIYESLRIVDWLMDSCTDKLVEVLDTERVSVYVPVYSSMIEDALNTLNCVQKLIEQHLAGQPVDVLRTEQKIA